MSEFSTLYKRLEWPDPKLFGEELIACTVTTRFTLYYILYRLTIIMTGFMNHFHR
jgi:hypothetical protein